MIPQTEKDRARLEVVIAAIQAAFRQADRPAAVIKRIGTVVTRLRNRGRSQAQRQHLFPGICEASGLPLQREHAVLDELEPESGYAGEVRWVCPRANNSGRYSCGGCG